MPEPLVFLKICRGCELSAVRCSADHYLSWRASLPFDSPKCQAVLPGLHWGSFLSNICSLHDALHPACFLSKGRKNPEVNASVLVCLWTEGAYRYSPGQSLVGQGCTTNTTSIQGYPHNMCHRSISPAVSVLHSM